MNAKVTDLGEPAAFRAPVQFVRFMAVVGNVLWVVSGTFFLAWEGDAALEAMVALMFAGCSAAALLAPRPTRAIFLAAILVNVSAVALFFYLLLIERASAIVSLAIVLVPALLNLAALLLTRKPRSS